MARSFSGRGMTLAQLNAATQAEALKKQQAQQAALQKLQQETLLQKPVVKSASTAAQTPAAALQVKQAVQAAVKPTSTGAAKTSSTAAQNSAITVGRTERVASVTPNVGDTVVRNGKTYTWGGNAAQRAEIKAAEAAAKVAAAAAARAAAISSLSPSSVNNVLIGGNTGSSTYYEIDSALESIYKQATAAGVSIAKPGSYGSSITDVAKAQAIIDSYTAKANSAISAKVAEATVYDTSSQFQEVYNTAKGYGVTVAMPAVTQYKSAAAAQAALDSYVEKVNTALANAPAPTYTNIDPQKTSGYAYTVGLSHAQQNNLIRRNQTRKQQGKPELSEFEYRQENGISTETTQGGNYVKPKLTNKSYSSNGSGTVKAVKDQGPNYSRAASVGSGDLKIANIKASAKTISPDNKSVSVISAAQTQKQKQAAVAAKNAEAAKATAEAAKAAQAKKEAEAELAAKQKALVKAQAAAKKTTSAPTKSALQQQAKTLQKEVNTSKTQVKAATEAASATAKYANAVGENAHYAEIAVNTGSTKAAQKASTALKTAAATKVKAEKAVEKASAVGVTDHTGQIMLADGTWINQVQKQGKGTSKESVKLYTANLTAEEKKQLSKEYATRQTAGKTGKSQSTYVNKNYVAAVESSKIAAKEAAEARANYRVITTGPDRKVIDAIQKMSAESTGEGAVTIFTEDASGKITSRSGTANEYAKALKSAKKIAGTPITVATSAADRKAILKAREYVTAREDVGAQYLKVDRAAFASGVGLGVVEAAPGAKTTFRTVSQQKQDAAVKKALAEAHKVNPKGSKEYFEGVANIAKRSQMSKLDLAKEDLTRANTQVAKAIAPILPDLETIQKTRDKFLSDITIKAIDKHGTREYTALDVHRKYQKKIQGNAVTAGFVKFVEDEYEYLRTKPVSYAGETAAIVAGGALLGAGTAGLKLVANPRLAKVAGKVAGKTSNKALRSVAGFGAKHGIDTALTVVPAVATAVPVYQQFTSADYKALSSIEKDAMKVQFFADLFKTGKDFAIAAPGFKAGSREFEITAARIKAMKSTSPKINKNALENALPSEFDITNVARNAPKAQPKRSADKITAMKNQLVRLESKGKPSDKPKVRALKRQIQAVENKGKNAKLVTSLKPLSKAEIKVIAKSQEFRKELAEFKELEEAAALFEGKPVTETKGTLTYRVRPNTTAVTQEIVSVSFPKTKVVKTPTTRYDFSRNLKGDLRSVASNFKSVGKTVGSKVQTVVKNAAKPNIRAKTPEKFEPKRSKVSVSALRRKLQMQTKARKIEDKLEKARIEGKVSEEAYYTAKSAAFRARYGMSTAKASKLTVVKKIQERTLGQKRASYNQFKRAHASKNTKLKEKNAAKSPSDITNVKGYREAFEESPAGKEVIKQQHQTRVKSLLKEAQKMKDFERSSKDLTNVVAARRAAANPRSKATLDDVGRMLNKQRKNSTKTKKPEVIEEVDDGVGEQVLSSKLRQKQLRKTLARRQLSNSGSNKSVKNHDAQFETYHGKQKRQLRNEAARIMKDSERSYLTESNTVKTPSSVSKPKTSRVLKGAEEGYFIKAELNKPSSKISKQKQIIRMKKASETAYLSEAPKSKKPVSGRATKPTEIGSGRQKLLLKTEEVQKPKQRVKLVKKNVQKAHTELKQEGRQKPTQRLKVTKTVMKEIEKQKAVQRPRMIGLSVPKSRSNTMPAVSVGIVNMKGYERIARQITAVTNQLTAFSAGIQIPGQGVEQIFSPSVILKPAQIFRPGIVNPPRVDQIMKPGQIIPPATGQTIKPGIIAPPRVDQIIKPGVIIPPATGQIVPPSIIIPPRVDQIVKPIVDDVTQIISIIEIGTPRFKVPKHVVVEHTLMKRKKPKSQEAVEKDRKGRANLQRRIQNRLGSLESLFGGSVRKPAVKKSVVKAATKKAPAKKPAAKKTIKTVRRA